ncbi:DUF2179 domain-containing protein [Campylobacter suis]|uniref:UPF0316 protein LMG8286_01774 n=1 Tax=Campylobacter suis TaxID=2790657 RepID=A0ABN7KA17_9BACT|nr:DUF2179 domain-containing protein [Campylobacter suis]CAD7289344.1 hypothetical protein LMG8286_01774 [Campylobacter suis]
MQSNEIFTLIGIPALICLARITDVTLGTIRIIFVSKGQKYLAPILGFFEIMVWLVAITQVMQHLDHWQNYIAYALGFALGNFLGIWLENKLALGNVMVNIVTKTDANILAKILRDCGYWVTQTDAVGNDGNVSILVTIIKRSDVSKIIPIIKKHNPWAVYSVSDMRYVNTSAASMPVTYDIKQKNILKIKEDETK